MESAVCVSSISMNILLNLINLETNSVILNISIKECMGYIIISATRHLQG